MVPADGARATLGRARLICGGNASGDISRLPPHGADTRQMRRATVQASREYEASTCASISVGLYLRLVRFLGTDSERLIFTMLHFSFRRRPHQARPADFTCGRRRRG